MKNDRVAVEVPNEVVSHDSNQNRNPGGGARSDAVSAGTAASATSTSSRWWRVFGHRNRVAAPRPPRPRKPRKPKLKKARLAWVGFAPAQRVDELADYCIKCGRPLASLASRRARVGTTCIRRYGPQPRKIPNPAYAVWTAKKDRALIEQVTDQAGYNAAYSRAMASYETDLAAYHAARAARRGR